MDTWPFRHRARSAWRTIDLRSGEADEGAYRVRHAGKLLEVAALDLSGTLDEVLDRVCDLAERVKRLRDEAKALRTAA